MSAVHGEQLVWEQRSMHVVVLSESHDTDRGFSWRNSRNIVA
jgi:hypothetical protein